jgi:hypothetical protein
MGIQDREYRFMRGGTDMVVGKEALTSITVRVEALGHPA